MAKLGQVDLFTRRVKKAPPPHERPVHIAIADALRWNAAPGWLWGHYPSGELRTRQTGALLQRMGVKPGWSDFLLVSPIGARLHALELKRRGNKPTEEQKAFLAAVQAAGGEAAWCDSFDDAVTILKGWGALSDRIHL